MRFIPPNENSDLRCSIGYKLIENGSEKVVKKVVSQVQQKSSRYGIPYYFGGLQYVDNQAFIAYGDSLYGIKEGQEQAELIIASKENLQENSYGSLTITDFKKIGDTFYVIWTCSLEGIKISSHCYDQKKKKYVQKKEKKLGSVYNVGKIFEIQMIGEDPKKQKLLLLNEKFTLACLLDPVKIVLKSKTTKFSFFKAKERIFDFEGVNSPNRGWFKLSFGGKLENYYQIKYDKSKIYTH